MQRTSLYASFPLASVHCQDGVVNKRQQYHGRPNSDNSCHLEFSTPFLSYVQSPSDLPDHLPPFHNYSTLRVFKGCESLARVLQRTPSINTSIMSKYTPTVPSHLPPLVHSSTELVAQVLLQITLGSDKLHISAVLQHLLLLLELQVRLLIHISESPLL